MTASPGVDHQRVGLFDGSESTGSGSGRRGRFFFSKDPAGNLVEIADGDFCPSLA